MAIESLPTKPLDLETKAAIFEAARNGNFPVINLKTGRTGKGEGCPYACFYCDVGGSKGIATGLSEQFPDKGGYWQETDRNLFKAVIENWADQGGKVLHWCGDGEPTTFKWFDTVLDLAKEHGFKLEIFSSLAGLTPERAEKLIKTCATVKFKMDSRNPVTLGKILTNDNNSSCGNADRVGTAVIDKIDMLVQTRNQSQNKPQLIASIVMLELNKKDLIEVLAWCCKFDVVPQINYMEEVGMVKETGAKGLREREIKVVNRWLKMRFGIEDPKQIMGDQCEAKAAPIVVGSKVFLGPFGMGCEFPLREHLGELNFIGEYQKDIGELRHEVRKFRFSEQNLQDIMEELTRIRDRKGIYGKSGTDIILPGCGDDIEELWLLEYVATIFTSDEYFKSFIANWVLKGEHRKWTEKEVSSLIDEVASLKGRLSG